MQRLQIVPDAPCRQAEGCARSAFFCAWRRARTAGFILLLAFSVCTSSFLYLLLFMWSSLFDPLWEPPPPALPASWIWPTYYLLPLIQRAASLQLPIPKPLPVCFCGAANLSFWVIISVPGVALAYLRHVFYLFFSFSNCTPTPFRGF